MKRQLVLQFMFEGARPPCTILGFLFTNCHGSWHCILLCEDNIYKLKTLLPYGVSPCFVHKTFLWAKKTPSFSGRSDNSRKKSRKALSGRKKKFQEAGRVLQVLLTSDVRPASRTVGLVFSSKMWSPVRKIPIFKDSCDVMELLLSRKMADRLPKRPEFTVSRFSGVFRRLFTVFMADTRWGQTTPQRNYRSVAILVNLE